MKTAFCSIFLSVLLTACTSKQNNMTVQEKNKAFFSKALDDFLTGKIYHLLPVIIPVVIHNIMRQ